MKYKNEVLNSFDKNICPFCQGQIVYKIKFGADIWYCPKCYNEHHYHYKYYFYQKKDNVAIFIRFDDYELKYDTFTNLFNSISYIYEPGKIIELAAVKDVIWNFLDIQSIYNRIKLMVLYI